MCLLVSYKRNSTYDTYIGLGYVIKGVDKALLGLCTGEKISVTVPPHLAYGGDGVGEFPTTPRSLKIFSACDLSLLLLPPSAGDLIPSSAVLVFDIHVIDFHNPEDAVQVSVTHKPPECGDTSEADDLMEYRYNCSLMDGTLLYSS